MNPIKPTSPPARAPDFEPTQIEPFVGDESLLENWNGLTDDSAPVPLSLMPEPVKAEPTIGHVGRYSLKECIGEGGIGRVYTAWDPILSRNLAVKVLQLDRPAGLSRESLDEMILEEARAVAGLNHPNIVTVYDAGLSPLGVYVAMEQMPGCDLRQLLEEGWRPDPLRAAKLVRRLAEAIAYAHGKGVVHCDIKPSNIFMIDRRKPKLLDFGLARVAHRSGASIFQGLVTGSPHYLAPEQLRGAAPDERTDVYALGVLLYELLTGRKAFPGNSVREIATAVLSGHPVPPKALVAGLPAELAAITERAMSLESKRRYPSAREMASALRKWQLSLAEQPGAAVPERAPKAAAAQGAKPSPRPNAPRAGSGWGPATAAITVLVALAVAAVRWLPG